MKQLTAYQTLQDSKKKIFSFFDLQKILQIESDNYASICVNRLVKNGILERISKGYYCLPSQQPSDFVTANTIYQPSYISLESALNYYGILLQTPYQITSVTTERTKKFEHRGKEFSYQHLRQQYFTEYQKVNDFLIATPEKALLDALFFKALAKGSLHEEELVLDSINMRKLKKMTKKIQNRAFRKYFHSLQL